MTSELTDHIALTGQDPLPLGGFAGDDADDDGVALDQYFEAADSNPLASRTVAYQREETPTVTRIIQRQFNLSASPDAGATPGVGVLVLPSDPNRVKLIVYSAAVAIYVSDANDFNSIFARLTGANLILDLTGHTGPLYAAVVNAATTVSVWAITR